MTKLKIAETITAAIDAIIEVPMNGKAPRIIPGKQIGRAVSAPNQM